MNASSSVQPVSASYHASTWAIFRGTAKTQCLPRVFRWGFLTVPFFLPLGSSIFDKWPVPLVVKIVPMCLAGFAIFWLLILFAIALASLILPFRLKTVTTSCDVEALREKSTTYNKQVAWRDIAQIFSWGGDVYFASRSGMQGLYVPREAFISRQEAEAFCENARHIWQNALSQ